MYRHANPTQRADNRAAALVGLGAGDPPGRSDLTHHFAPLSSFCGSPAWKMGLSGWKDSLAMEDSLLSHHHIFFFSFTAHPQRTYALYSEPCYTIGNIYTSRWFLSVKVYTVETWALCIDRVLSLLRNPHVYRSRWIDIFYQHSWSNICCIQ
jgi:hypothetical protein